MYNNNNRQIWFDANFTVHMHALFNTIEITSRCMYFYIANRLEVAEAVWGISPTRKKNFIVMNLKLKSLGLLWLSPISDAENKQSNRAIQ